LIDIGMYGVAGVTAVYLIEGKNKCLIDGGTRTEAKRLWHALKALNAFPPDMIIATHSHYDHVQAIPFLRREATKKGKTIKVLASEKAIPLMADQSYNEVFDAAPYENIPNVTPLREGDVVDLDGVSLRVFESPGHHKDHIALLDETNRTLFVGDAIGIKISDGISLPPFMPPFWDPEAFYDTINKLKQIDYEALCLAHFGYICGDEAHSILDEAVTTYESWWELFEKNADKMDDVDYIHQLAMREMNVASTDLPIISPKLKLLYGLAVGWHKLIRRTPPAVSDFLSKAVIGMLVDGYKSYQAQQ
jgi:glyoxylase-like metal-dependent hydrolase (beta-lactamase superfamily II)